jgi:hypothetical protein
MSETFVIGAGPLRDSLATHLRARQVPFEIVGEPMQSWRKHMPPGMNNAMFGTAAANSTYYRD